MREAGCCGMNARETRGTESWLVEGLEGASRLLERPRSLRVRHWRDNRSGLATRETCLLLCVCLCMRHQGGTGIQGPVLDTLSVQGHLWGIYMCVWVSVKEEV